MSARCCEPGRKRTKLNGRRTADFADERGEKINNQLTWTRISLISLRQKEVRSKKHALSKAEGSKREEEPLRK